MPVTTQSISAVLATYLRQGFAAALLSTLIVGVAQARTLDAALAAGITP